MILFSFSVLIGGNNNTPVKFWNSYSNNEKIAFINGVYGTVEKLKAHHQVEVKKQYARDDNWVRPYYIERFYDIANEYRSGEVGYNLTIVASHMDAFYTNSDNFNIPVLEALRIVSLIQDGNSKLANLRLIKAQQKYNK